MSVNVNIHPEVTAATDGGQPIVLLESAVITAGLPRDAHSLQFPESIAQDIGEQSDAHRAAIEMSLRWRADQPVNLQLANAMEHVVRAGGAVPATVALIDGCLHIGITDQQHATLASVSDASKVSIDGLATAALHRRTAGTTVAATLAACRIMRQRLQPASAICFATGGIGGVHQHWFRRPDISADLLELNRTPVPVICSGGKSILDLVATREALETLGVPVVGYRTAAFPAFYCRATDPELPVDTGDDVTDIARMCSTHWNALGFSSAVLVCQQPPDSLAFDIDELNRLTSEAEEAADDANIHGPDRTPFLLNRLAERTRGRSLITNIALLLQNAALATELAIALQDTSESSPPHD